MFVNEVAHKFFDVLMVDQWYHIYSGGSTVKPPMMPRFVNATSEYEINVAIDADFKGIGDEEIPHPVKEILYYIIKLN